VSTSHASMDLRQLRYFVQIADAGSLSRAADILRIAQPSLSLQIKNLEEGLRVQLLIRHAKGVTLTDHGKLLYEHARHILKEVDRAHDALQSSAAQLVGRVSVGIPTSACRGLSSDLIATAQRDLPGISIRIVEAMTAGLDEWIESGKLDVALLYDHKAYANVAWTEMMLEELMLIVPVTSALFGIEKIPFRELEHIPLVLPGPSNVLRTVIERHFARLDMELNVAMDCDSLPAITQLVRNGHCTIMPHFAMAFEIAAGQLSAVAIVDPVPSWRLSVVLSKRTLNTRASEAVAELLARTIRTMLQQGLWRGRTSVSTKKLELAC
jgi:LysR family nitrogen assimilation transcriptional regulator